MTSHPIKLTLVLSMSCFGGLAFAQAKVDVGKQEYDWHCASCHGESGTGNGELKRWLTRAPSDLTTIAKRNGGAFPNQLVWEMIDGRSGIEIGAHGSRTMSVWGQRYRAEALGNPATAAEGQARVTLGGRPFTIQVHTRQAPKGSRSLCAHSGGM